MEARVQIISREMIKPSSKTPNHLKKMKLSYLDQLTPAVYLPILFFYQSDEESKTLLTTSNHVLKQSLSDTLTAFYPLAGSIQDNFVVNCNDNGVVFISARVEAQLVDVIKDPISDKYLKQYIPKLDDDHNMSTISDQPILLVQLTRFDCGGISVGFSFLHKMADFASIVAFIRAWAGACRRGGGEVSRVNFDLADFFPARDYLGSGETAFPLSDDNFVTKRFVFDKEKLEALKEAAISQSTSTIKNPTRVELVSTFIWKHFIDIATVKNDGAKNIVVGASHVVNLRLRKTILENTFGNCIMLASAFSNHNNNNINTNEFQELLSKLRNSIRRIDDDYIMEAQSGDSLLNDLRKLFTLFTTKDDQEFEWCIFSSWCRFPLYEVDYGWGRPVWLCTTALPLKNFSVLVRSKCGEGIEAWVNMNEDNLKMLETKVQLIISST